MVSPTDWLLGRDGDPVMIQSLEHWCGYFMATPEVARLVLGGRGNGQGACICAGYTGTAVRIIDFGAAND